MRSNASKRFANELGTHLQQILGKIIGTPARQAKRRTGKPQQKNRNRSVSMGLKVNV